MKQDVDKARRLQNSTSFRQLFEYSNFVILVNLGILGYREDEI